MPERKRARRRRRTTKKGAAQKAPAAQDLPMHAYLAKGEANACGEGCSEWIAVEGRFDSEFRPSRDRRSSSAIARASRRCSSIRRAADGRNAIAIGRFLRARGMTAGVGKTVPQRLHVGQRHGGRVPRREAIGPGGRCGMAAGRYLQLRLRLRGDRRQGPAGTAIRAPRRPFRETDDVPQACRRPCVYVVGERGAVTAQDQGLPVQCRVAALHRGDGHRCKAVRCRRRIPHEDVHYLSRDEIAGYGIDRREFAETPWFTVQTSNNTTYLNKWIAEARGPERKDHRISLVMMGWDSGSACACDISAAWRAAKFPDPSA